MYIYIYYNQQRPSNIISKSQATDLNPPLSCGGTKLSPPRASNASNASGTMARKPRFAPRFCMARKAMMVINTRQWFVVVIPRKARSMGM